MTSIPISAQDLTEPFAERISRLHPSEALVEANRCLFCEDALCTMACPTHTDIPSFIKKIATRGHPGGGTCRTSRCCRGGRACRTCLCGRACEVGLSSNGLRSPAGRGRVGDVRDHSAARACSGHPG